MQSKTEQFRDKMLLIVHSSFEASSQNPTIEEEMLRAATWTDLLVDIIPPERLQDSFKKAFAEHDTAFPINAYEIKLAWESIEKIEAEQERQYQQQLRKENAVLNCKDKRMHLKNVMQDPKTQDDIGMVEYVDWFDKSKFVIMPCATCRPSAHEQARSRHIEKNGGNDLPPLPGNVIDMVVKMANHFVPPESAEEIIKRARFSCEDPTAFLMLGRTLDYVRNSKGAPVEA